MPVGPSQPVLVYGTLRPGGSNHDLITGHRLVPASLDDHALYGHGLPFPYAVPSAGHQVHGDLCYPTGSSTALLARLDELEGYVAAGDPRNHYERVPVTCRARDEQPVTAWVYVAGPTTTQRLRAEPHRIVASGDWRDARRG